MHKLRFIKFVLIILTIFILMVLNIGLAIYLYYSKDLPKIQTLKDYNPPIITNIYDRNGTPIFRLYNQRRTIIDIEKLPKHVVNAFLAAEDADFFTHKGIDISTVFRALMVNILSGRIKQGGSTITQQVVKTLLLTPERTLDRKIKEAILSYRIEKNLSKKEILHLYLNQIYFGAGNYGIVEASRYFFNKDPENLTISEAAFLSALVKAPEPSATFQNPQKIRDRQLYIIRLMEKNKFISSEEAKHALSTPLNFEFVKEEPEMNYSISHALKKIKETTDISKLYLGGYRITLTIDKNIDDAVQRELTLYLNEINSYKWSPIANLTKEELYTLEKYMRSKISEFRSHYQKISDTFGVKNVFSNKKIGFKLVKPIKSDLSALENIERQTKLSVIKEGDLYVGIIVFSNKNKIQVFTGETIEELITPKDKNRENTFKPGDVILYFLNKENKITLANPPIIQGAVIILDNKSGQILGMSGGYDYNINEFNRATQAKRQPGSAFKPILYSYAIESGKYNIVSIENDAPVEYTDPQTGKIYRPSNYDKDEFKGEMTLIDAIAESKNTISVRLILNLGLENVFSFVERLGLETDIRPYPSMALGAFEITLLSLSNFYSALANEGVIKKPEIILSITSNDNVELLKPNPTDKQIIMPETAYIITRMLKEVVIRGTGTLANVDGISIAGKTGTTNNYTNAWFIGYTPDITIGILIGRDDNRPIGKNATGGHIAAPLFKRLLQNPAISKLIDNRDFKCPSSIKFILTNIHTGKRCDEESQDCLFLPFREGEEPINSYDLQPDIMKIEQ
ncbi:MAG: PBP1A family penicillin-binding protein [Deltaproteobacteria bacterium]|nr:PBP1A family penicillin-binding protein [Deltaproteobacteria bacterium]